MSRILFAVSIGPVQDFIAAARRTRDLWRGSNLLSEAAKAVARAARAEGADLIFPAPANDAELAANSPLCVSNKLLFSAETAEPKALATRLRHALVAFVSSSFQDAAGTAEARGLQVDRTAGAVQTANYPEFFAAWVPLGDAQTYAAARTQVESLLAARKGLRDFGPHRGSDAHKSTIDGVREDVITLRVKLKDLKESERLDAMGLIKRFTGDNPAFSSTLDVAAVPYARKLAKTAGADQQVSAAIMRAASLIADHYGTMKPFLRQDLYENAQLGYLLKAGDDDKERKEPAELTRLREQLHRKHQPPEPYYAVLMADGDHMGQAIDNLASAGAQRDFSLRLAGFASAVQRRLAEYLAKLGSPLGTVVYAGGDDVLAFVPVDCVLQAADAVHEAFADANLGAKVTVSVGITIAHANDDLTAVVESAHGALNFAKKDCGRDALAICLSRRSGAPFTIGGHWDQFPGTLRRFVAAYRAKTIPGGLGYEWRQIADRAASACLDGDILRGLAGAVLQQKTEAARDVLEADLGGIHGCQDLREVASRLVAAKALHKADIAEVTE